MVSGFRSSYSWFVFYSLMHIFVENRDNVKNFGFFYITMWIFSYVMSSWLPLKELMDGVNCPLLQLVLESGRCFSKLGRVLKNIAPLYDGFLSVRVSCCWLSRKLILCLVLHWRWLLLILVWPDRKTSAPTSTNFYLSDLNQRRL